MAITSHERVGRDASLIAEEVIAHLESLATARKYRRPLAGAFCIWRRGRDSNPRYAINVHTLSRRAP